MSGLTIVAIPEKDDYVWKMSSETVPHMSLLFLGVHEVGPQTAKVAEYLEHATNTMLRKFGMSVERRDTLGPLDADVLLFDMAYCSRELNEFRAALLKSPEILGLYNEAPQFEEWIPHLTLGYPDAPANEDTRDYPGVHWVNFDKIALWVDDFEGPEIQLGNQNNYALEQSAITRGRAREFMSAKEGIKLDDAVQAFATQIGGPTVKQVYDGMDKPEKEVAKLIIGAAVDDVVLPEDQGYNDIYAAMSDDEKNVIHFIVGSALMLGDELEHSGVKGMKWGVRKDDSGGSRSSGTAKGVVTGNRDQARAKVKAGTATLGEAHLAATKSKGHRVANTVLGDKTFWKRTAAIAGLGTAGILGGVGVAAAAPAILPASFLAGIATSAGLGGLAGPGLPASAIGAGVLGATVAKTSTGLATVGQGVNYVSNIARGIRGNTRVNKSYARMGNTVTANQRAGTKRTQKVLNRAGSVPKRRLKQDEDIPGIDFSQKVQDIDALQFGRKGMRWGVRRAVGADGRVVGTTDAEVRAVAEARVRVAKAGKTHGLSDAELRAVTDRINLETNYVNAVLNRKTKLDVAHAKVKKGLDLGKTANSAINFGGSNAGQLLISSFSPRFASKAYNASKITKNIEELQKALDPNRSQKDKGSKKKNKGGS